MRHLVTAIFLLVPAMSAFAQQGSVVANSGGQASSSPAAIPETKFEVPDAARRAILFTKYALDVRLETRDATMHARAIVTVKNESAAALDTIPCKFPRRLRGRRSTPRGSRCVFNITQSQPMRTIPARWMKRW